MKLRVLMDNNTYIDQYYLGEPAASYYIEAGECRILFDTGYSDAFLYNADKLGIDLGKLTHIVLSHGHNDHTGGLKYLKERFDLQAAELIAHPDCFVPRRALEGDIGSPVSAEEMQGCCQMHLTREPVWLNEACAFLGEIPARLPFETPKNVGQRMDGKMIM